MGCGCCKNYDYQFFLSGVPKDCRSGDERIPSTRVSFDAFDKVTRLPNLLIELRQVGFVEICGKDHLGVYSKLGLFLKKEWGCIEESNEYKGLPVCDLKFSLPDGVIKTQGSDKKHGDVTANNMGRLVLQLVRFMANELGWTLSLCNTTGGLGARNAQIKFKAPNPLNLVAPHILVELKTWGGIMATPLGTASGFVEINITDQQDAAVKQAVNEISAFVSRSWGSEPYNWDGKPQLCELKLVTKSIQTRGLQGENTVGLRTAQIADFMTRDLGWTMLTCDLGGSFGREQQMVFRLDPQTTKKTSTNLIVELRQVGYVEISGANTNGIYSQLDSFLKSRWGGTEFAWEGKTPFCDLKYQCTAMNPEKTSLSGLADKALELINYMHGLGWTFLILNGGELELKEDVRFHGRNAQEMQLKFVSPCLNKKNNPILLMQLRASCYSDGLILINGDDVDGIHASVTDFFTNTLQCVKKDNVPGFELAFVCPVFYLSVSEWGGCNLDVFTMRLCDFMVDHLGGWDLLACSTNHPTHTTRAQLLAFSHVGGRRKPLPIFEGKDVLKISGPLKDVSFPSTWSLVDVASSAPDVVHGTSRATKEEHRMLQELLDSTFKNVKTRDRTIPLPARLLLIEAVASEHIELFRRYHEAKSAAKSEDAEKEIKPLMTQSSELSQRAKLSKEKQEVFVLHGTRPSAALNILQNGFTLDVAGSMVGLMFGRGIYCAESSTKADEYAQADDAYPDLYAMLVCRAVLGRTLVVTEAGDYGGKLTDGEVDTIIGDREVAVGTFREFVIGSAHRLYPEYVIMYRREQGGTSGPTPVAPPAAQTMTPLR